MMDRLKARATRVIESLSRYIGTDMMYVVKNGFWMNANFIVVSIFGLVSSVILAHLVSKADYGTYQFILAIASILAVFVPNNMSSAVLRSVARGNEGDFVKATKFQLRWGIIGTILAALVSVWYALNQNFGLSFSLIIIALFMPATYALNTWSAYVQGKKDYKRYFLYNTLGTFISYGTVIVVLLFKREYLFLAIANIVASFASNLVLYLITIKKMCPNTKIDPETIPYGKHLSVIGIPAGLVSQIDVLLIFHYMGATPLAVYSFATLFPERLAGGLKFISTIIFPKFSEKTESEVKSFFNKKIWWLFGFLSIIVISYCLVSPFVFRWFFPAYIDAIPYTQIYAFSFFSIAAGVAQSALLSQKRIKELYMTTLAFPFVKAGLSILLLFMYGIWGIIWAQLITILFQIVFPMYLIKRKVS